MKKALMISKKAEGEDHPHVVTYLHNTSCVYHREKEYLKVLEKASTIHQKHLPSNHSELGTPHNNIDKLHDCLGHYDLALEQYNLCCLKTSAQR